MIYAQLSIATNLKIADSQVSNPFTFALFWILSTTKKPAEVFQTGLL